MKRLVIAAATLLAAVVASLTLGNYWLTILTVAIVDALACLSLVVLTGWSGQLNLHVAALGLGWGAYAAFALTTLGVPVAPAVVVAGVMTIPLAVAVGAVAVRFRGLELAVATLAIGLIFERLAFRNIGKLLSGDEGTTFGSSFVPLARPGFAAGDGPFFVFCAAVAVAIFLLVSQISRSATGRALTALKEREAAAETLGIPVVRYRVGAFAASIAIAATAGALLASLKLGVAPDSFNIDLSFQILAAAVIGGIASPAGAVIGGSLIALLPEVTQFGPLTVFGGERLFLLFGSGMVLALWRLPGGLASVGHARRAQHASPEDPQLEPSIDDATPLPRRRQDGPRLARPAILRTSGIRVRFGGVVALDGVDVTVREGEITAIIGPNGAGKSTLFNCVSGLIVPDSGRVYLRSRDITELSPSRRAAAGIARTFQTIEVFRAMTVRENLHVAAGLLAPPSPVPEALSLPSARRAERTRARRAVELLSELALESVAEVPAADLPLGLLRVLEAGMALASDPALLLLDEPSAGLDAAETAALGRLILRAREQRGIGVLVVEHDMSLVRQLADHVIVLDFGAVIAEGTPDAVRHNPVVIDRYLGSEDSDGDGDGDDDGDSGDEIQEVLADAHA